MNIKLFLYGLIVALAYCGQSSLSHADELLDQGLKKMAEEIKGFLQDEGRPLAIVVGDFTAPPRLKASGGVELSRSIAVQLQAVGISVSNSAAQQLMGKFKLSTKKQHTSDDFESLAMEIEATVLDANDQELVNLPISVFGSVALQMAGQTVDVPVKLPEKER